MDITATVWTLLPPIIAIALALITKEVYSSLLIGILAGALLYTGFNPLHAVETTFEIMGGKLGEELKRSYMSYRAAAKAAKASSCAEVRNSSAVNSSMRIRQPPPCLP